jgi:CubicO group peptidase (beta-lactamase class C family)
LFSGQAIISHKGKVIYSKQFGLSNSQTQKAIDKNTLFNIGSLNKQFTAEMIHQLVNEHKLAYSDKLNQYLHLFPDSLGDKITIQHLLDMKSGLGDYLNNPGFKVIENTDFQLNDLLKLIQKEPLLFEPGTRKYYSNSGYAVLGGIIEKITGKSFEANLIERIALPLGLKNMYYTKAEKEKQLNRASGTEIDMEGGKKNFDDISNSSPAGGIYTDGADLLKFTEAKMNSKLPSGKHYGTGMFAGGTPLWNSVIYFDETHEFSFVVMANTGNIADKIARRLKSILSNEPVTPLELPDNMNLYRLIQEKGTGYIKDHIETLAKESNLPFDDRFLNYIGYQFLNANKIDLAIQLFQINVELFPKIANVYDSLAEGYLKKGDKQKALVNYKSELAISPTNANAKKMILDLENGK